MAVRPFAKLAIIFLVIIAGIGVTMGARSRFLNYRKDQEKRFVLTYITMSVAREKYIGNPGLLRNAINTIYEQNKTDSVWMADYGRQLSNDLARGERVWAEIVARLDSLGKASNPDSLLFTHKSQP
jgi:hypothetical protein